MAWAVGSSKLGTRACLCSSVEKAPYCRSLLSDQLPFQFRDPRDPRIDALRADLDKAVYAPDVLRAAAANDYGAIEVQRFPEAELVVFDDSAHMMFIEEHDQYINAVGEFLARRAVPVPVH